MGNSVLITGGSGMLAVNWALTIRDECEVTLLLHHRKISLKGVNFSKKLAPWIVLLIVIVCIGLISNLWLTLIILVSTYIASIIYTVFNSITFKN